MDEMGFWQAAQALPDALALVDPDGGEQTAGELLANANRVVHGLRALGLGKGDCVATVLPNGAPMVELYLAALQAGWYITPLNFHLTAAEIAYILADCEAKAFVTHERLAETAKAAVAEAGFRPEARFAVGHLEGFRPYEAVKDGQPGDMPAERATGAVMTYTAGTTGRPKGVRRPIPPIDPDLNGAMNGAFLMLFGMQARDSNVHLVVSPLYHTAVANFALDSLHLGHAVVLMDKWTPEGTLERIERHRVTTSHMVPTQFKRLLALPRKVREIHDLSSLRHMVHSAAPCPPEVKKQMIDWWGPVIDEYYAATEGGGTLVTSEEWLKKPGTVGRPWPISQIRVTDDDFNDCAPNEPGTVWIKMGEYTFEYNKDREKTSKTWRDGFFTVGDVGYLDDDGYLFLCDRKADMIISGGVNIYPAEVESAMILHLKVGDVAVFGIPDEEWGEQVKAVVEPAEGVEPSGALAEDILEFTRERVAGYKCPKTLDFTERLPRDPNGKLYKRALRDPYWAGRERNI